MKAVATASFLGILALLPLILVDTGYAALAEPVAYTMAIVLTSTSLLFSVILVAKSGGERRTFAASAVLTSLLMLLGVVLVSFVVYSGTEPLDFRYAFTLAPLPLVTFGAAKLVKDWRFLKPESLVATLVASAVIVINYTALKAIVCAIPLYILTSIVICIAGVIIYSILLVIYIGVEARTYWLSVLSFLIFYDLMILAFIKSQCVGDPLYTYPTFCYNLSLVALVVGLYEIYRGEIVTFSLGELEERRRKLEKLYRRLEELRDVLSVINKMLRHDILNKLHIIHGYIEAYEQTKDATLLERARDTVWECVRYIERLRDLERAISSGSEELKPVSVREVVEDVLKNYDLEARVNGRCVAMADDALYAVIDNILSNVAKHSGSRRVDVLLSEYEDECEIRIADYGIGIPDELKQKVFEEGFSATGGSGLGLYIVRKVVERYGGRIWIEDNKPRGTVFVIRLKTPKSRMKPL
ncbi:MAG: HAMP domain-containing sensor histidine kinase [Archaeoglobaceae archaeon]